MDIGLITELKTFTHTDKLLHPQPASHKRVWPRSPAKRVSQQAAFRKQGVKASGNLMESQTL